ncbi:hypothetical protein [Niallia sp. 01092]|uniref:hypothetical protein n=1 Tax=unclassified Niallia TaxID=2837522 RepID=UPI003FD3EF97
MANFKKITILPFVLTCFLGSITVIESNATVKTGKITFYDGVGKIGADEKKLTRYDCAVSYQYRKRILRGTPIETTNVTKRKTVTLYKWDYGNFKDPIILDVQRDAYKYDLGGVIDSSGGGWISNGKISY